MKFSEIVPLNELFQTPVAYRWESQTNRAWEGAFEVNGLSFEVFVCTVYSRSQNGQRVYLLDFIQDDDMHNTGKAGTASVRVAATVLAMLKEFITTVRPTEVMFHGKTGEKDRLYSKMFSNSGSLAGVFKQMGYEFFQTSDNSEYKTYHIHQIAVKESVYRTEEPDEDWRGRQREWNNTADVQHPDPKVQALKEKLLSIGGWAANIDVNDPDLDAIVERGQVWSARGSRIKKGKPVNCHANCARLYEEYPTEFQICTGYAMSGDGLWRQHSWGLLQGQIIETTVKRLVYYGFILNDEESKLFCTQNR